MRIAIQNNVTVSCDFFCCGSMLAPRFIPEAYVTRVCVKFVCGTDYKLQLYFAAALQLQSSVSVGRVPKR